MSPGLDRELTALEADLKRLEGEYNMFFAGRASRPPVETRSRVEATVKRLDRSNIQNYGERFRFLTLQTRFAKFIDLWDRGLRAREEGRPGPFVHARGESGVPSSAQETPGSQENRVLRVAAFRDPSQEVDKLRALYESVIEARREVGADSLPFHRFADLVKAQVQKLQAAGNAEVAFRVAVKDGKVSFVARALRSGEE